MPFKSKAQQRFMFAAQNRGDIKPGTAERFAKATPNMKKLPQYKYKGGLVGSSERAMPRPGKQYGGAVAMHRAYGGTADGDEGLARGPWGYGRAEYGGPVAMSAAYGGTADGDEALARGPGGYGRDEYGGPVDMYAAYGGTSDGDEARGRGPDGYGTDEYGGPVDLSAAHGGMTECPNCGHQYAHGGNVGRHMQPGFQDMDPETADQEADLHLGKALLQEKMYSRRPTARS